MSLTPFLLPEVWSFSTLSFETYLFFSLGRARQTKSVSSAVSVGVETATSSVASAGPPSTTTDEESEDEED